MKKSFESLIEELKPAAVMLLCACLAFSVTASYLPPASRTAAGDIVLSVEETPEETTASETEAESSTETNEETREARDLTAPAPYRLNFAYMFDEGSEESYAEILMKELIKKDSQWFSNIYDMANMAPANVAARLGHSEASVLGAYNPASKTQDPSDPSTWAVEHFKNVRVSFYDGDGSITSAVSNAQQILSMASVYCYYNGIEDLDSIRSYVNGLWSQSHSYSASMGSVYYCIGCVDPDSLPGDDEEDSDLAGEDSFNGESNINTEITVKESGAETAETDENGETITGSDTEYMEIDGSGAAEGDTGHSGGTAGESQTERPAASFSDSAGSSTMSPLDSLAATAESVYIEETKPRVTIIRTDETSTAAATKGTEAESSAPAESETSSSESSESSLETESTEAPGESAEAPGEAAAAASSADKAAEETAAESTSESRKATIVRPEDVAALEPASVHSTGIEYRVQSAAISSTPETSSTDGQTSLICPGHIDLQITAKIYSLDETNGLFAIDQTGNTVEEGSAWSGWTDRSMAFVSHIDRQDWTDAYNISVTLEGTRAPLSSAEIESYMKLLPEGTSQVRQDIIRFALQSVGKVPYYWGGKAGSRNYSGNNFGSITIPDYKGRILKGLDCSGWISWVYWSVTGTHLAYESTEGLRTLGRQVDRQDLKPGDIIVVTGNTPHAIMFLGWASNGQIICVHESGTVSNVTVSTVNANWPYYRNLLD